MAADLYFVTGLTLVVVFFPLVLGALLEEGMPVFTGPLLLVGLGLMIYGITLYDGAFSVRDIPNAFIRAFGYWLN